jgi:branched-chain amino acid transport system permease protein
MINLRDKGAELWENSGRPARIAIAVGSIGLVAALPLMGGTILNTPIASYESVLVYPVAMFVLMAIGLNIVIGKSGLLDLGYVAFFAIGAYTMGLLGTRTSLNTWEILPIGIAMSMFAGLILGVPALKLRGDYLAIITLGFGEIVRIVALNLGTLGRSEGIINIPTPPPVFGVEFAFDSHRIYYWTLLIMILFAIWMVRRLSVRRAGRAWESIRQDEDVAELLGVPTFKYKI